MNELYSAGWIYFQTDKKTLKEASEDFYRKCESIGLNVDNMKEIELRDENGNEINEETM